MQIPNPFARFFNDPDLENVESFINGILTTPVENKDTNSENNTSKFLDQVYKNEDMRPELDELFSKFSIPVERLQRYGAYDEVYRSVQMIKRIVKVYKPYIIQKNPVTGLWYLLTETDFTKSHTEEEEKTSKEAKAFFTETILNFDLLKKLKNNIIHNQLLYGDSFVEVLDLGKEKARIQDLSRVSLLTEATEAIEIKKLLQESETLTTKTSFLQRESLLEAVADKLVDVNPEIDEEELLNQENKDIKFQNTIIRVHKPHNIIILQTLYGTVLGYLEVNKKNITEQSSNIAQTLSTITNRIVNTSNSGIKDGIVDGDIIVKKIIQHILKKVNMTRDGVKSNGKKNAKYSPSVIDDLKRFVVEQDLHNQQINLKPLEVRFIPVSRMVSFNLASSDNYPYGGSLLEPLMLPGKLFILTQLSNVMQKLSRSPLTRKWIIDSGSQQNVGQLLQKLKRELHNSRIGMEDLSSFKSVSKIMSDYKDMFVLSKNGVRALDVEVNAVGDPSVKVQDLEDWRREIIALSGVPAPYLGYMDVVELREQLIHANIGFSTEIVDIQEIENEAITKLVDIIAEIEGISYKPSKYYKFSLIAPVVLILQLIEMTMSSIGNIFGIFQTANLSFDPYTFLEQYVPYINWDEFRKNSEDYQRKVDVKSAVENLEGQAASQQPNEFPQQ